MQHWFLLWGNISLNWEDVSYKLWFNTCNPRANHGGKLIFNLISESVSLKIQTILCITLCKYVYECLMFMFQSMVGLGSILSLVTGYVLPKSFPIAHSNVSYYVAFHNLSQNLRVCWWLCCLFKEYFPYLLRNRKPSTHLCKWWEMEKNTRTVNFMKRLKNKT